MRLNLKYVSELVGNDYKVWKKGDVVKIKAQTGTGKTYAILGDNGLIDNMQSFETLVYICNRIELKRQIKLDLLKKFCKIELIEKDNDTKDKDIIIIDDVECDMNKLDKLKEIKNISILSYHEIAERELDNIYYNTNYSLHNFDYIVCDECHFFLTDAGFNSKTSYTFFNLVREHYPDSVRIFISATMDEVNLAISRAVNDIEDEDAFADITVWDQYDTGIDYSYLDVKYFKSDRDVIQTIKNDKSDDKWLIFVTSKNKGNFIKEELLSKGIKSEFIHARNENKEKQMISSINKFSCKVLISTKCLDNGVNIKDDELKNIVVMAYDKTTFIQELGRLRINIENARSVNLFIPTFDIEVFNKHVRKYNKIDDMINTFESDIIKFKRLYNDSEYLLPNDIFYLNNNDERKINVLGMSRMYSDKSFTEDIVDKLKYDKFAYIKEQLSWMNLEFNAENFINNVADEDEKMKLSDYLDSLVGTRLYSDEQQELSDMIIKELTTVGTKTDYRTKKLKPGTIEKILRDDLDLNYAIDSKKKDKKVIEGKLVQRRYWTISRI